jgi:hypothetical protein
VRASSESRPSQRRLAIDSCSLRLSHELVCIYEPKHTLSRQGGCQGESTLVLFVSLTLLQLLLEGIVSDGQGSFLIFLNLIRNSLIKICDETVDLEACATRERESRTECQEWRSEKEGGENGECTRDAS